MHLILREQDTDELDCGLGALRGCELGSPHLGNLSEAVPKRYGTQLGTHLSRDLCALSAHLKKKKASCELIITSCYYVCLLTKTVQEKNKNINNRKTQGM